MRFEGKTFADKHCIEIRSRQRQNGETLQNLHSDIRRQAALAFPDTKYRSRKMISTDYFLAALANLNFVLKVREKHLKDLDSALQIALQLEVWTKDSERLKLESLKTVQEKPKNEKSNEVQYDNRISDKTLKRHVAKRIRGKDEKNLGIKKPNTEVV